MEKKTMALRDTTKRDLSGWLIMLPSLVLFAFFIWVPLLDIIRISLFEAKGLTTTDFVGLANYVKVAKHPMFLAAFRNTFSYTLWSLIIGFCFPIIIAALLTETVHLKSFFRVGVYFPNIVPGLAAVLIMVFFFRPGETGVLNILLGRLGVEPLPWLTNANWTIPLIVIAMTWKAAGSTALIYVAGLGAINGEMYEAAAIDGASPMRRFWHITVPGILSLGKTMLILQIIAVFQILYEPMMMTNGGPNNASLSAMQLVYRFAFEEFKYPLAASMSVMISLVLVVLTAVYFILTRTKTES